MAQGCPGKRKQGRKGTTRRQGDAELGIDVPSWQLDFRIGQRIFANIRAFSRVPVAGYWPLLRALGSAVAAGCFTACRENFKSI